MAAAHEVRRIRKPFRQSKSSCFRSHGRETDDALIGRRRGSSASLTPTRSGPQPPDVGCGEKLYARARRTYSGAPKNFVNGVQHRTPKALRPTWP
jgi:hypothetical protein